MGALSIVFAGGDYQEGPFDIGQDGTWFRFGKWAKTFPAGDRPVLTELFDDGEAADTVALSAELTALLVDRGPSPEFAGLIGTIVELIGDGDADETAAIVE